MFCTECGTTIEDDARFCPECGAVTNADAESGGFCTGCGQPLEAGSEFCAHCGQPVDGALREEDRGRKAVPAAPVAERVREASETAPIAPAETVSEVVEGAPQTSAPRARQESAPLPDAAPRSAKLPIIIGAAIAVVAVIVCIIIVVVFAKPAPQPASSDDPSRAQEAEQPVVATPSDVEVDSVDLPNTFVTDYESVNLVSFPSFAIDYPDGWSIEDHYTVASAETCTISAGSSGLTVEFDCQGDPHELRYPPEVVAVEKVADSAFVPSFVQSNDYRDMGPMIVARIDCEQPDPMGTSTPMSCYAVVPQKALSDFGVIQLVGWKPGFEYGYSIAACSEIPDEGLSEAQTSEVIATLASFREISSEEAEQLLAAGGAQGDRLDADYVLPDSSTRLLSSAELQDMSNFELFVARNEIFARHGRTFQKQELKDHFGSKSWYHGTVSPEAFTDSMLSDVERKNIETIKAIEQSRDSQYLLP